MQQPLRQEKPPGLQGGQSLPKGRPRARTATSFPAGAKQQQKDAPEHKGEKEALVDLLANHLLETFVTGGARVGKRVSFTLGDLLPPKRSYVADEDVGEEDVAANSGGEKENSAAAGGADSVELFPASAVE